MSLRNGILTISACISTVLFPWPLTVLLAVAASFGEPLVPLAVGIFADTLYYAPQSGSFPLLTFYGLIVSILAVLVRRQLRSSIMR